MTQSAPERREAAEPHWEVRENPSGGLTAILTETYPPLTVTAYDLESLRKKVRAVIMRAML